MQNKYMILSAIYYYEKSHALNAKKEKLEKVYLSVSKVNNFITRRFLKKGLEDNFGVNDYKSSMDVINDYWNNDYTDAPIDSIFINIYLENKDRLDSLSITELEERYLNDEYILNTLKNFVPQFFRPGTTRALSEHTEGIKMASDNIIKTVRGNFSKKTHYFNTLFDFFKAHESLLPYAKMVGFYGFDISRIITIIGDSYNLGYLDKETTVRLLNEVGKRSEKMFENWENFLASCLLGKQFMMSAGGASGEFIIPSDDYLQKIYGLLTAKTQPLYLSGIWLNSNLRSLAETLEPYIDEIAEQEKQGNEKKEPDEKEQQKRDKEAEEHAEEELKEKERISKKEKEQEIEKEKEEAIDLFNFVLGADIAERQLEAFFYARYYSINIHIPAGHKKDADEHFWDPIKNLKIDFEEGEIPFFFSNKLLLTNKAIYQMQKKLFKERVITKLSWKSEFIFEVKTIFWGTDFYFNGEKIGHIDAENNKENDRIKKIYKLPEEESKPILDAINVELALMLNALPVKLEEYEKSNKHRGLIKHKL